MAPKVTVLLVGTTGDGKSAFANRYLEEEAFETNDSPDPVTLEPQARSSRVDDVVRQVIDTEGHADGNSISSQQIQKLAAFVRDWRDGVNGIAVVLNGQADRFSQGAKDTLRWVYNTFGTPEVLSHICIIFTRCYDSVRQPNRPRKTTEYRQRVQTFLAEVSGLADVPVIPVYFVDSLDWNSQQTQDNMVQFHGWLVSRPALATRNVKAVALRDKVEQETEEGVFVSYRYEGKPKDQLRFAKFQARVREKITPYNGDPPRYGEWRTTDEWEEEAGRQKIETFSVVHEEEEKIVEHHAGHSFSGFSSRAHTHFRIERHRWQEQWTRTTDFDGNVTETEPVQVGEVSTQVVANDRERGHTQPYRRVIQ
jgi:predicted GTPase